MIKKNTPPYYELEAGVKVYTALLQQSGTNAPVATVLKNTLGDIVWTRDSAGFYIGTLEGKFTADKTFYTISTQTFGQNIIGNDNQPDTIFIETTGTDFVDADGKLLGTPIEIRVYP